VFIYYTTTVYIVDSIPADSTEKNPPLQYRPNRW